MLAGVPLYDERSRGSTFSVTEPRPEARTPGQTTLTAARPGMFCFQLSDWTVAGRQDSERAAA